MTHDPRQEASDRLGGRFDVRVLEPSPPSVDVGPWFADDPVHRPGPHTGPVVAPVPGFDHTWDEVADGDASLSAWCADRWLGAWRRLSKMPASFDRAALHARAEEASAARAGANGKIGLRWVHGGFGTPCFGDEQVRVDDVFSNDLFGFGSSVLEELRVRWAAIDDTRVQLWPEHFDLSIDCGVQRATYGISPGDDAHDAPYLYVSPWEQQTGPFWDDRAFPGASLPYEALLDAGDQRGAALSFFQRGWDVLHG